MQESMEEGVGRRRFLRGVIGGAAAIIGAVTTLPGLGMLAAPLFGRGQRRRAKVIFKDAADSSAATFVEARFEGQEETAPGLFVRRDANGQPVVFSARCTHAGCGIAWKSDANKFLCPCHQGQFDANGKVLSGPPPRPLQRLRAERVGSDLYIEEPEA